MNDGHRPTLLSRSDDARAAGAGASAVEVRGMPRSSGDDLTRLGEPAPSPTAAARAGK